MLPGEISGKCNGLLSIVICIIFFKCSYADVAGRENSFFVFQLSMVALAISGAAVVGLNAYINYLRTTLQDPSLAKLTLTKVRAITFKSVIVYIFKNQITLT